MPPDSRPLDDPDANPVDLNVIVIGAGAAGLAAAKMLEQSGVRTLIVEARERLGGRIFTQWLGDGTAVDMGAAWLHGRSVGNPLTALATNAGADLVETDWNESMAAFEARGSATGPPEPDREMMGEESWGNTDEIFANMVQLHVQDQADRRKFWPSIADESLWSGLLKLRSKQFDGLDSFDERTQTLVRALWADYVETDYAVEMSKLSYTWWDADDEYPGPNMIWPRGFVQLIEYLAKGLNVRLRAPVLEVVEENDDVKVVLASGEVLKCTACICTLPLGVLKAERVKFQPPLAPERTLAMTRIGVGLLNKIAIRFDRCFWPEYIHTMGRFPVEPGRFEPEALESPFWVNLKVATGSNTLVALFIGDTASLMERHGDDELVARLLAMLRSMFPEGAVDSALILDVRVVRWHADEFAMGSYAHLPVGSTPDDITEIAKPHGLVYFAGEATHQLFYQTVHGAYLSGIRAAQEVLARFPAWRPTMRRKGKCERLGEVFPTWCSH